MSVPLSQNLIQLFTLQCAPDEILQNISDSKLCRLLFVCCFGQNYNEKLCFSEISQLFIFLSNSGLGHAMVIVSWLISLYYNVIIAQVLFYLFASFTNELPWTTCSTEWHTNSCLPYNHTQTHHQLNGTEGCFLATRFVIFVFCSTLAVVFVFCRTLSVVFIICTT